MSHPWENPGLQACNLQDISSSPSQRVWHVFSQARWYAYFVPRVAPAQEAEPPDGLVCPITDELMLDPVLCADGHSYERASIREWLENHDTSPLTGVSLEHKLLVLMLLVS